MANEKQNTEKARELTLYETAEAIANDLWERYSDNDMGPQDLSDFKADIAIAERWLESHAAHVTSALTAENERLRREWGLLNVEYHKFKFKLTTANERITELSRQRDFASEKCLQLRTELAALRASFPEMARKAVLAALEEKL
jgi:predicted  nucleic acid-binding Zn-ribbon protein